VETEPGVETKELKARWMAAVETEEQLANRRAAEEKSWVALMVRLGGVHQCNFVASDPMANGVLHYMGTNCGTTKYRNPHETGLVLAQMSSIGTHGSPDPGAPERFIQHHHYDTAPRYNFTRNVEGSWMSVDLREGRSLVLNHYALRHGWKGGCFLLLSWVIEGSQDGKKWDELRRHTNDRSMPVKGYGVANWQVENTTAYRRFRIRITGENLGGGYNTGSYELNCAGIELYGKLLVRSKEQEELSSNKVPAVIEEIFLRNSEFGDGVTRDWRVPVDVLCPFCAGSQD
jgi:hypothetical protein